MANSVSVPKNTPYYNAGTLSSATSWKDAITTVFNNLNITEQTVIGKFGYSGQWMFMAFKYAAGTYGMMIVFAVDGACYEFRRYNGTDYFYSFTKTNV